MVFGFGGLALLFFALWVYALVDALRRTTDEWARANQNQLVWVLVILIGNALGAGIYLLIAKPQLESAR